MSVIWLMMNPLYSSWNNALDYSRYPRGNTAPTVLPQMHYRYRGSTVHSVPSPRYYREILPIPTVITAFPITVSFSSPNHQTKSIRLGCESACQLLSSTPSTTVYYYTITWVGGVA